MVGQDWVMRGENGWSWGPEVKTIVGDVGFFVLHHHPGHLNLSLIISSESVLITFSQGTCLPPFLSHLQKQELWFLSVQLRRWTVLTLIYKEGKGWFQRDLWSRKLSCHYCCQSLGQQMLYWVTAASWLFYLGVNKRQWWSWSDLELMTVVIFSMKKGGVACGGKLLHTCNVFRQFWCDIHPAEVWMLVAGLNNGRGLFGLSATMCQAHLHILVIC